MQEYRYLVNFKTQKFAYTSSQKLYDQLLSEGFVLVATPRCSMQSHPGITVQDKYALSLKPSKLTDELILKIVTNFYKTVLQRFFLEGCRSQKSRAKEVEQDSARIKKDPYWYWVQKSLEKNKKLLAYGDFIPWKEAGKLPHNLEDFRDSTNELVQRALHPSQKQLMEKITKVLTDYVIARAKTAQDFNPKQIKADLTKLLSKLK